MQARYISYTLDFKAPSGTSRGILRSKDTWYLILEEFGKVGIGECGMFRGLSSDDVYNYQEVLQGVCELINASQLPDEKLLAAFPSIKSGLEQALLSFDEPIGKHLQIPINGLVWMGEKDTMASQVKQKIEQGFGCIKIKIGAIRFEDELSLLKHIRKEFSITDLEIRVDANGAFAPNEALEKLKCLSDFDLHSIEQPIRQGQWGLISELCRVTPLPIALDEELIGVSELEQREELIRIIRPQYIILKPSLVGGFASCDKWIELANKYNTAWWITSALESNVGLCSIARYTASKGVTIPQGLGTGELFTNNITLPIHIKDGYLIIENDSPKAKNIIRQLQI